MRSFVAVLTSVLCAACGTTYVQSRPVEAPAWTEPHVAASAAPLLGRDWIFVEIAGFDGPLPSPPPVAGFIMTAEGGLVRGTTACNTLSSGYDVDPHSGRLRFIKLRNNRILCDRIAADTEEAVLDAMIKTDAYQVSGDTLVLYSDGQFVARLVSPD